LTSVPNPRSAPQKAIRHINENIVGPRSHQIYKRPVFEQVKKDIQADLRFKSLKDVELIRATAMANHKLDIIMLTDTNGSSLFHKNKLNDLQSKPINEIKNYMYECDSSRDEWINIIKDAENELKKDSTRKTYC
jgi:hypothetical protein